MVKIQLRTYSVTAIWEDSSYNLWYIPLETNQAIKNQLNLTINSKQTINNPIKEQGFFISDNYRIKAPSKTPIYIFSPNSYPILGSNAKESVF